ncbi:hypothetical protein HX910_000763 [Salmonella enterica]|nr:hypothetical protein [Salmonella enterica]EFP4633791.1 hypothetical protein [Salmonella enterica]EFS0362251.1 hypothetical protein [Salmonella enterica]EGK1504561.1 hypothetical protein [Salmonella enterica]
MKENYNIGIANIAVELTKLCIAHPLSNRYTGLPVVLPHDATPLEIFDAIYDHLRKQLADER